MTRCLEPPKDAAAEAAATYQSPPPRFETERLILRVPYLQDFPVWGGFFEAGEFDGDAEHAWEEFSVYVAGWLLHGHGLMALEEKATGDCVGFVLLGLEWEDPEPELGWMLAPKARGKGYATEAAARLRDHALDLLGSGKVVSYIYADNLRSARVAARLNATCEGAVDGHPDTLIFRHHAS